MYKQAAIIALNETIDLVAKYIPMVSARHNADDIKSRAIIVTGINIAKRLLEESDPKEECEVHIIQMDSSEAPTTLDAMLNRFREEMQAHKAAKCPRCCNEEISPGDKFCKICGMALLASKGAE